MASLRVIAYIMQGKTGLLDIFQLALLDVRQYRGVSFAEVTTRISENM